MKLKLALVIFLVLTGFIANVSADAVYTNDIDIGENTIIFTINETYTSLDAWELREMIDANSCGTVYDVEVEQFKQSHLDRRSNEYIGYILIDEGAIPLEIDSIDMDFENAEGDISNESIKVITVVSYNMLAPISSGDHELWILGHPLIQKMEIMLPNGVAVVSSDGLDNMTTSSYDGRVVLEGASAIRTFMAGNRTTFEYATSIEIYKKPFYAKSYFMPLLIVVELLLVALALYSIKNKKQSS